MNACKGEADGGGGGCGGWKERPGANMCDISLRGLSLSMLRDMNTSTARPLASQAQAMSN